MAFYQCIKLGGGGTANIVNCTQAEYDALPSSKESDNVLYIVYFDGGQILDPDYSYYTYGDNDEIIVRVYHEGESDQQILWFFRGWNQTGTIISVPSELSAYAPTVANQAVASKNFTDNTGATQNGWIGFYSGTIRAWSQDWASNITGVMYGVVDPNGSYYPNPQTNSYVDDPYIYIQDDTATRRIYMNGREYAEFNNGEGGGGGNYYLNTLYSTEEKKIGYWTDGKLLYQKTFTQQLSGVTGSIDISALNAETAFIVDGYYDIGVTNIGLNEWLSNGNYSYTHVNNELSPPYIDCYCTWSNSTITVTLQYTKTTDTPESNPQTGGVIYLPSIYSDEEREVGVWTDGKPLYQITIDQTIGSDSDYTIFSSGIEDAHIVNAKCEYSSGRWMSANYPSIGSLSSSRFCYVEVWNGALKLHNQTNQSMRWVATIQYTKTTDVAGGGTWTPSGELAHHYSTNEQVIGTWIDNKPLYQKTIQFTLGNANVYTQYLTDIANPETIMIDYSSSFCIENGNVFIGILPYTGSVGADSCTMLALPSNNAIRIDYNCGTNTANKVAHVTLKYTKTTD